MNNLEREIKKIFDSNSDIFSKVKLVEEIIYINKLEKNNIVQNYLSNENYDENLFGILLTGKLKLENAKPCLKRIIEKNESLTPYAIISIAEIDKSIENYEYLKKYISNPYLKKATLTGLSLIKKNKDIIKKEF
ncbi:hypothetical protein HOD61_03080 [archaeon]|jgi:hypothetical protein|nr:hypothetical protein [archaeon]